MKKVFALLLALMLLMTACQFSNPGTAGTGPSNDATQSGSDPIETTEPTELPTTAPTETTASPTTEPTEATEMRYPMPPNWTYAYLSFRFRGGQPLDDYRIDISGLQEGWLYYYIPKEKQSYLIADWDLDIWAEEDGGGPVLSLL